MGQPESRSAPRKTRRACPERCRRDGWTAERQLTFLAALSQSKSVTKAAHAVGMSRESAYRLRTRDPHGLFAAVWDRATEGHNPVNFARGRVIAFSAELPRNS